MFTNYKLGVLGGGQLGRMLVRSAIDANLLVHVLDSNPEAPCKHIAGVFQVGDLMDYDAVYQFGQQCDLITIEIERVNTDALEALENEGKKVYPQANVIRLIQDKRLQKQFYQENGIPTAEFKLTENLEEVLAQKDFLPFVNKIGKGGYDGRGVQVMRSAEDLQKGFDAPGLVEKMVDIEKEISVIVARNAKGEMKAYPPVELVYHPEANMVDYLLSPAQISEEHAQKAEEVACTIIQKLDMIGLLAVELFLDKSGNILVNEIAPRTHNSGHHTIESNMTSQFEQHLRSILNLPLGDPSVIIPAAMVNILGEPGYKGTPIYVGYEEALSIKGSHLHLYGKDLTKPMRKMGHMTITDQDISSLIDKVKFIQKNIKVIA